METGAALEIHTTIGTAVQLPGGKQVTVKKANLRTMKPILDTVKSIFTELEVGEDGVPRIFAEYVSEGELVRDINIAEVILKLISNYYESIINLASLHLDGCTKEELLDMDLDDALTLILKIVEINQDFFTKRVAPMFKSHPFFVALGEPTAQQPEKQQAAGGVQNEVSQEAQ
jgi:hypothetical protein